MTRADIAKYIPYHNRLFHDSAAAGYAEVWDRNDLDDAFYLSLSNSVGGAVIVANKIFEGERRKSGEIGHMTIIPKAGDRCYCGQRGCFDTVCRANVLAEYADGDLEKFFEVTKQYTAALTARPEIKSAQSTFNPNFPQYMIDIDAAACKKVGISPSDILATMQGYYCLLYTSPSPRDRG